MKGFVFGLFRVFRPFMRVTWPRIDFAKEYEFFVNYLKVHSEVSIFPDSIYGSNILKPYSNLHSHSTINGCEAIIDLTYF